MRYSNKPIYERIAASPLALFVALLVMGLLGKAAWNIHQKEVLTEQKLHEANDQLAKLQDSQADMSSKVAYLSTDDGIEAEMRTKFKAVKNGESVAVIVDDTNQSAAVVAASTTESTGWWQHFLQFLGF